MIRTKKLLITLMSFVGIMYRSTENTSSGSLRTVGILMKLGPGSGRLAFMLAVGFLLCSTQPSGAQDVLPCDHLAADPWDDDRVAPGVPDDLIQLEEAEEACKAAVETHPDVPRLAYQYGRVLAFDLLERKMRAAVEAHPDVSRLAGAWLERAANMGYVPAIHVWAQALKGGVLDGETKTYERAFALHLDAAEAGYAPAQYALGYTYARYSPPLYSPDRAKAAQWYRAAAEQGYVAGQFSLAELLNEGVSEDGPTDAELLEATSWYKEAADMGHPYAQVRLGRFFREGKGVEKDCRKAVAWYNKSVEQKYLPMGARSPINPNASINLKGAQSLGMEYLGTAYLTGCGVPQDDEQGAMWIQRAATEYFNPSAQAKLAYLHIEGRGVSLDPAKAEELLTLAGRNGNDHAELDAAVMQAAGLGVPRNPDWALHRLYRLIDSSDEPAIQKLARHHIRNIQRANPEASSDVWGSLAGKRGTSQTVGPADVLLGLMILGMLTADGNGGTTPSVVEKPEWVIDFVDLREMGVW